MTIALVFVNYFSSELIAERVDAYADADVVSVVVDNSGDYRGPGTIIDAGGNIGFGSACNLGVRALDPSIDTVILHNPDVYPSIDLIEEAARRVRGPRVGIVAPGLATPDGVVRNGYSYPRLSAEIVATRRHLRGASTAAEAVTDPPPSAPRRSLTRNAVRAIARGPRFGSAALLAVDVQAFHAIEGFDDRFILYGEDLDLWHRMRASGQHTLFADDLSAFHERGGGSPASRQTRELLRLAGIELFAQLHQGSRWRLFRAIHERSLGAVESANKIAELLGSQWSAGADPLTTSGALRECFLDGVMEDPGSNSGLMPRVLNQRTEK